MVVLPDTPKLDDPNLSSSRRHAVWATRMLPGQRRTRWKETTGRTVRWQQQKKAVITDGQPVPVPVHRKELICRRRAGRCELCKQTTEVKAHQVRKLADLGTQDGHSPRGRNPWQTGDARPCGLLSLPRAHPRRRTHGAATEEPDESKPPHSVRQEDTGRGSAQQAPRQRPTSLPRVCRSATACPGVGPPSPSSVGWWEGAGRTDQQNDRLGGLPVYDRVR